MEPKRYFFSKVSKRETLIKSKQIPIKTVKIGLVLPQMAKIYGISRNISLNSPPFLVKKPVSLSPIASRKNSDPRSQSLKQVKTPTFSQIRMNKKSIPTTKSNIRYLKQDFDDLEVLNNIKTPEESLKNTKNLALNDLHIPDFDEILTRCKTQARKSRKNLPRAFESPRSPKKSLENLEVHIANRDTSEE
jgi:hypothetical protein